jgi:hypothetical protein
MGMPGALLEDPQPLRPSPLAARRLAASTRTGAPRRTGEAERTVQDGGGPPLLADTIVGWGRQTVAVGLAERRTGLRCLGAPAALDALRAPGDGAEPGPSPSTRAEGRQRLGCRRRQVVKAQPPKKLAAPDAMLANREKKPSRQRPRHPSNAGGSRAQPRWPAGRSPAVGSPGALLGRVSTTWAGTSPRFPGDAWMKTGRRGGAPVGARPRPVMASAMGAKPGGRWWRRPSRWP